MLQAARNRFQPANFSNKEIYIISKIGFVQAFARYGATLKNPQWSVCAVSHDGSLVVSLWQHQIHREGDYLVCRDDLKRWHGPGNNELRENLKAAFEVNQPIKVVIAEALSKEQAQRVQAGDDASKIEKAFYVREDLVGSVVEFDGEKFAIRLERRATY